MIEKLYLSIVAVLRVYRLFRYSCTYATHPIFISSPFLASSKSWVDQSHLGDVSGLNAIMASPTCHTCHTHSQTLPHPQSLPSSDQRLTHDECAACRCLGILTTTNSPQCHWATTYSHIRRPRSVSISPDTDSAYHRTTVSDFSDMSSVLTEILSPSTLSPTPAQTPLPIHSQHSHHPPIPTKLQLSHPYSDSDEMPDIEPFKGSNSWKENPQAWLHRLEGTKFKHDTDDKSRVYTFSKYLEYGSKADTWFMTELTVANKSSWASLTSAFNRKWPPSVKVQPKPAERQAELLDLKLADEEVGRKIGDDEDDQVWSHVDWAQRVKVLTSEISDTNGLLIPIVHGNLPLPIHTLLPNDITTWDKFCQGVCDISMDHHSDEVDCNNKLKMTTSVLSHLSVSSSPNIQCYNTTLTYQCNTQQRTPYNHFQSTLDPQMPSPAPHNTLGNPSTSTVAVATLTTPCAKGFNAAFTPLPFGSCSNADNTLVGTRMMTTPSATTKGGFMALVHQAIEKNIPYPNVEEGLHKYNTAIAAWHLRYGQDTDANWDTDHLPLSPGTSPLGLLECYCCGISGHNCLQCD